MSKGKSKLIFFSHDKESGTKSEGEDSPRSSFYYDRNLLTINEWTVTFHFLDWPHYNERQMNTITVGSTDNPYYQDYKIIFQYIRGESNHVIALTISPEKKKQMSIVTFDNYEMLNVIDAFLNNYKRVDPPGFVYMHYLHLTGEEYEEKKKSRLDHVHWGPIKFETVKVENVSIAIDNLTDLAAWPVSKFKLV